MSGSTEAKELDLCGKVEMRIALATDDKLEPLLKTYLPPLLLKLNSEHYSVRTKVISTCQHIKVRLRGNQSIILPVAALLKQYKEHTESPVLRQFDLMFIQQSLEKLSQSEQIDLLPILLHGLAEDAGKPTCATVFNLFLRLLPRLRIPERASKDDNELRAKIGLQTRPEDAKFVAKWLGKLLLLTLLPHGITGTSCPGLTTKEYEFLTLNYMPAIWDPSADEGLNLTLSKITALSFLASGAFIDEERFLPALFASGDTNSRISAVGDDLLKRSTVSPENHVLVSEIFDMYFTVRPALQTRILLFLSKSAISTTFPMQIVRVVQEGIRPDDSSKLPAKGLETVKFRNALFAYMNWVSRTGSITDMTHLSPQLVVLIQNYIEDQGWPKPHEITPDSTSLRALGYETMGTLAKPVPSIILEKDLSLIRWLFRSLTEEGSPDSIFVSVEEALGSLLSVFSLPLNPELTKELRSLLLNYMNLEESKTIKRISRYTTVRWANRCLEYGDVVGRWIDILALGGTTDERSDVIEEGKKGLDPYWYQLLNSTSKSAPYGFPDWNFMISVFFSGDSLLENSNSSNTMKTGMAVDGVSVFGNFPGTIINAFTTAVNYSRRMLLLAALQNSDIPLNIDADWERQLDVLSRNDKKTRLIIRDYMKTVDDDALFLYLTAAFEGMLYNDGRGLGDCGKCFVEIASISPSKVIGRLAKRCSELVPALRLNDIAMRSLAAHAFGILSSHPETANPSLSLLLPPLLKDISGWSSAVGAVANAVHGSILATGFALSRSSYYGTIIDLDDDMIQQAIRNYLEIIETARDATTKDAALVSIGLLGASNVLTSGRIEKSSFEVKKVIGLLTEEAKKGNSKAITALGRFSVMLNGNLDEENLDAPLPTILTSLFSLSDLKEADIHFSIGEALSCVGACWQSDVLLLSLDVDASYEGSSKRDTILRKILAKLLQDCKTTKPSLKKASGIWLFSLIQNCGHLGEFQERLRECQVAFMGLLTARDELVQETASRGLSLVYEQGDFELREKLVKDLVLSFTGASTQLKVDDETELFEPGALPTGEGKSVTSYKDIINLANEVGDQSLVYKFMSLAANAATWSTRAAFGRFGLSNILSESEIDPKLYPKLYRYRFDPNPNVRRSMNDIWNAIVKDSNTTINDHFDEILGDLLKSITGKEWRTREACCGAIADLVQGREFSKYEKYLHDIWHATYQVLDDIKGSVRAAALALSQNLTGILVRQLEAGSSSKNAHAMLKEVLPFLLSGQGMESSAKDVRVLSTLTVLKLIKNGGATLLPFVPTLVEQLLGLISSLEQEGVDYLYLNAANYNRTTEEIDNIRTAAVSKSPLMEAIERCLDLLDEPTMKQLAPSLERAIQTSIGMPSKIGCSGVLVSLSTRHSFIFRPHADTFLKAMEKAVLDRNTSVSAAYARSTGYLARLGSEEALSRLASYTKKLYYASEDETRRQIASDIVYSIAKSATDRFTSRAADFLPFTFFAKHDADEHVKEQFKKTWDENVGGSRAVLLYMKEIIALSIDCLDSPKWTIKHTAAFTIADTVISAGSEINAVNAGLIWPALEKSLALKTFEGKEKILTAFIKFTKAGKSFWESDSSISEQMRKIAIREAKRNNDAYRPNSFENLGDFCEARTDLDMFEETVGIIQPILEDLTSEGKMDTTDDESSKSSHESITITNGLTALFKAINTKNSKYAPLAHLPKLLEAVRMVLASTTITSASRSAQYDQTKRLFEDLPKNLDLKNSCEILLDFFLVLDIPSSSGTEVVRIKRAEAAGAVVKAILSATTQISDMDIDKCTSKIKVIVMDEMKNERSFSVKAAYDKILKILS